MWMILLSFLAIIVAVIYSMKSQKKNEKQKHKHKHKPKEKAKKKEQHKQKQKGKGEGEQQEHEQREYGSSSSNCCSNDVTENVTNTTATTTTTTTTTTTMFKQSKQGLLPLHISFKRNIVHLKEGKVYALSVCINASHSLIALACSDESLQFYKLCPDTENISNNGTMKMIHRMNEIYECIAINEDGSILVGVDEVTTTLRVFQLLYTTNDRTSNHMNNNRENKENNVKKVQLLYKGQKHMYSGHVCFLSIHKKSYIISGSEKEETDIKIWSLKGELLQVLSIRQISNVDYSHSLSGRMLSVACWSAGIQVFEFIIKEGNFQKVNKMMDLRTQSGTNCLCFSNDETKVYAIDKKGILRVYNINVRYQQHEDPKMLNQIDLSTLVKTEAFLKLITTGDSLWLVAASGKMLYIMDTQNFKLVTQIEAHTQDIAGVRTFPETSFIVTWAYDGYLRLWDLSKQCKVPLN